MFSLPGSLRIKPMKEIGRDEDWLFSTNYRAPISLKYLEKQWTDRLSASACLFSWLDIEWKVNVKIDIQYVFPKESKKRYKIAAENCSKLLSKNTVMTYEFKRITYEFKQAYEFKNTYEFKQDTSYRVTFTVDWTGNLQGISILQLNACFILTFYVVKY